MLRSAFAAGMMSLAVRPQRTARPAGAAVRIAVLGDSLALGTGASRADGGFIFPAFRTVLAQRPGSRIDNLAIGGATVADVLRLEVPRLAGTAYDVAIVCVGGNDVVHGTAPAAFRSAYATVLRRIAGAAPGAGIVCCGVPDVGISPIFAGARGAVHDLVLRDDRAVRAAAHAAGAAFVDLFTVTHGARDPQRFLGRDRFHPSDDGYRLLAAAFAPVLARAADG
jgi:lysophospholipase L1-like esterase